MPNQGYYELTSAIAGRGTDLHAHLVLETTANTLEPPAASNQIVCNGDVNPEQAPEIVRSDARVAGSRAPFGGLTGPVDHGTCPIPFEWRPPNSADIVSSPGAQYPMGHDVIKAFMGSHRTVNSQAGIQVASLVSWSLAQCVITVTMSANAVRVGDGLALRVNSAAGDPTAWGNGQIVGVTRVEPISSGVYRLTMTPGFQRQPTSSDYVRGCNTYLPDDDFRARWSLWVKSGYMGRQMSGGIVNELSADFSRREIFKLMAGYEFRRMERCAEDQVSAALTSAATAIPVGSPKKFVGNPQIKLVKLENAGGTTLATEGPMTVSTIDPTSAFTITVEGRAGGTVSASAADLVVWTNHGTSVEVSAATRNVSVKRYLRMRIDGRPWINIDLMSPTTPSGAGASATPAELVANINYQLGHSEHYGRPYQGMLGYEVNYETCASVSGTAVRIAALMWGSQSRIQVEAIGDGSTSAHDVVFTGAFSKQAPYEIQVLPYAPAAVEEERDEQHGKEGFSTINGYLLPTTSCNVKNGNAFEWFEDVRTGGNYVAGGVPGKFRDPSAEIGVDANGWTDQLEHFATNEGTAVVVFQAAGRALGSGFAIGFLKTKVSYPKASGEARVTKNLTLLPEKSVTADDEELAEMYIWNC